MERRIDYETLDKGGTDCNIYVRRTLSIDVPNTDTLFKIIDILGEGYEDLRLRKLERTDNVQQYKKPKAKTGKGKRSTITIGEDIPLSGGTWTYHDA